MKKYWLFFAFAAMISCNNEATNESNADTTAHSGHTTQDTTTTGTQSTSGSMMDLMDRNMDQMKEMRSTGNADQDFAALMKTHHMGGVEMARLQIAQGTDAQIKAMAEKMITDQQKEINELDAFLSGNDTTAQKNSKGDVFHKASMKQMGDMKMDMDHSGSIDKQFVQMMILHHQGGIDMARTYLLNGARNQKLKTLANNIVAAQQKEITEMQAWLKGK